METWIVQLLFRWRRNEVWRADLPATVFRDLSNEICTRGIPYRKGVSFSIHRMNERLRAPEAPVQYLTFVDDVLKRHGLADYPPPFPETPKPLTAAEQWLEENHGDWLRELLGQKH